MPTQYLAAGLTANYGANVIQGTLSIIAPSAGTGTYSLNGAAPVPFNLGVNAHIQVAVNGAPISISNTTAVQYPAGTLILSY